MKKLLLLFILVSSAVNAQEKNFSDLFVPARESCAEKERRIPILIIKNGRDESNSTLDSLLGYWQQGCESSEVIIRTQILHELNQGIALNSDASLASFYAMYINNLSTYRSADDFQDYLAFTSTWAQTLLNQKTWDKRENLCLKILSTTRNQAAKNLINKSESLELKEGRETKKELSQSSAFGSNLYLDLGYANTLFTEALEKNIGTAHGFMLNGGISYLRHDFGFDLVVSFPNRSDSVRVLLEGISQKSDINSVVYFGGYYAYEFLKTPRTSLAFRTMLGYNLLNTDLNTYNVQNDTETLFSLESLSLGLGLEWKIRLYGTRQIGIRSSYNYCNFNRNNELRSSLSGSIIQSSIFFRF